MAKKVNSSFSLNFKTNLLSDPSLDIKKTPVYFVWNFLIQWPGISNFEILRELDRAELICSTGVSGFHTFKLVFCIHVYNKLCLHAENFR